MGNNTNAAGKVSKKAHFKIKGFSLELRKVITVSLAIILMSINVGTVAAGIVSTQPENNLLNFIRTKTYDNMFSDINGHWAGEYIINAYEYGIISGIEDGLYDPEGHMTVAQAITIAAKLHMTYRYGHSARVVNSAAETDHWANPFIDYAENESLITGGWRDRLDDLVTRAEVIRIWSRILKPKDMASINTVNSLPDIDISTPYFADIIMFYEAGIVQGSIINGVQNSFNPYGNLSRAEAAAIFMTVVETDQRIGGKVYGEKTVRTFAGTGTSGFMDEALATASFTLPYGLTMDSKGVITVFDTYNNSLRTLNNGSVETLTGQWITEDSNRFSKGYYQDGILSEALFNRPTDGVYNAAGELFVCDSENHVIRIIKNGRVSTYAGTTQGYADGTGSSAKFDTPMAIAIDKTGNLYVADTLNNCIRKIDAKGNVTTVAGVPGRSGYSNESAAKALFRSPSGIAVNEDGSVIYVADTGNHSIRKIENGAVTTLSGVVKELDTDGDPVGGYQNGAADEAMFNLPKGITLAENLLFVADSGNNAIRAVNLNGHVFTAAGTGEPGDREGGMLTARFNQPAGVHWHEGVLYIADTTNNIIKVMTADTAMLEGAE